MRSLLKTVAVAALVVPMLAQGAVATDTVPFMAKAREILEHTVSIRSAKGQGLVPKVAEYLAAQFKAGGFDAKDIHILPVGKTAALVVRYHGDGSSGKKPILLSGHMDVVDALRKDWERDPFKLIEENGYFYGRGAEDDKWAVAVLTATFLRLKAEGFVPNRDLIIAFSGDEETDMATTKALAHQYRNLIDADFALIADGGGGVLAEDGTPQSYNLQAAEKTYATFEATVHNPGGHSSRPRKDNAIYELATALKNIQAYQFPAELSELTKAYFLEVAKRTEGPMGDAMRRYAENPKDTDALMMLRSDPEYIGTTGTTCVATMLRGGHAENALPQSATATINCRIFPGTGVQNTLDQLKKAAGNDKIEWKRIGDATESPGSPLRKDVVDAVTHAVHATYPNVPIVPEMSSGASDGMYFRAVGIPSYGVTGAFMKASDEFAHGLNERMPVASLPISMRHWYIILHDLAGK
ncbi:M20/M25/M40 family metallo-hydrolase [Kordiimonas marina]|uniref:M20/M25/M40 family metallo-hydrolase n=1 Tax=Kordiimonas marina TaxID=2872312 RepID=UPI001FF2186F|nr:M20/M25/M40 family metallo-hydrolase [Kordiimonas marina]MCJ9430653.1 M20/M25/M40 family metallo-hydrolase [Kordiimonas marina]